LKPLSLGLGCLLAAALLAVGRAGPDFDHYLDWSRAFSRGDIFEIRGPILSPNDVPLSQWSHGTGLILSIPLYLTGDRFGDGLSGIAAGWIIGMVFWWAMYRLLFRAAAGDVPLTLFGMGAAFVGTHAGFYSHTHGSESVGYALAAVLALVLVSGRPWRIREALVGGAAAALLIMLRSNLALFALPAAALLGARAVAARRAAGMRKMSLALGWLIGTAAIGLIQVAWVNRWMTGNLLQSPYLFGGDGFHSFEFGSPQVLAVLAHPWHGLLSYHPLYAVGMAAVIARVLLPGSRRERLGWLALGALVLVHLYLQASWYVWWLGTGTFGQRGMSITAVLLIPGLLTVIGRDQSGHGLGRRLWILLSLLGCLWSYLLLLQGETNFFTYTQLLDAQLQELAVLIRPATLLPLLGGLILPGGIMVWILGRHRPQRPHPLTDWAAGLLSILSLSYLGLKLAGGSQESVAVFGLLGLVLALVVVLSSWAVGRWFARRGDEIERRDWASTAVGAGVVATLLATSSLFARLAVRTERWIATDYPPPRAMECGSSVLWDEVQESFREYQSVTGFESQKLALETFLLRSGGADCPELALP
jgi:hypothetical protein